MTGRQNPSCDELWILFQAALALNGCTFSDSGNAEKDKCRENIDIIQIGLLLAEPSEIEIGKGFIFVVGYNIRSRVAIPSGIVETRKSFQFSRLISWHVYGKSSNAGSR